MVDSWNNHTIPGKGIPDQMFLNTCHPVLVTRTALPTSTVVAADYRADGGVIRDTSTFGNDPLQRNPHLFMQREILFGHSFPSLTPVCDCVVNHNNRPLKNAVVSYIDNTESLCV